MNLYCGQQLSATIFSIWFMFELRNEKTILVKSIFFPWVIESQEAPQVHGNSLTPLFKYHGNSLLCNVNTDSL